MRRTLARLLPLILCACHHQAQRTSEGDADIQKFDSTLAFLRNRNAKDYAITSRNGIDEAKYVEIGGIQQWITIRGEERNNPVLLFLHGGPGDATNPWGYAGFRSWLKYFTVVQWDQRGAGRTLGKNGPSLAATITIDRMARDGVELAEFLHKSLRKDKIILVGHSWGSILGVFMAKARPDLFYAFVGTGQVADPAKTYALAYSELLKKAEVLGEQRAIDELRQIHAAGGPDADYFVDKQSGGVLGPQRWDARSWHIAPRGVCLCGSLLRPSISCRRRASIPRA